MFRTRLYRDGALETEDFPASEISDHLDDPAVTMWLDLGTPDAEAIETVAEELGLHHLAVEDAVHRHQRPKLDRYDTHLFTTAYAIHMDEASGALATTEVAAFVTRNVLVTVSPNGDFNIQAVVDRWDENKQLAQYGVAYLLYGLLDYVVDTHFEAVQALDDIMEELEDALFEDGPQPKDLQRRTFTTRKNLVLLRRTVLPMREVVNSLMRRDLQIIDARMDPYFQDVYDHVLRATEWTESLRDLVTTILETRLSIQGNRLNTIMKQVTSWAAIIAVPTAVTGFYGQNVPYPGFGHTSGFWVSTVLMVGLSAGLWAIFRKRDWI